MDKKELWLNIANYHFDDLAPTHLWDIIISKFGGENPFTKAFADKLCRKLNWKNDFAHKALWEYKKFVYLGVISDFSVTPSKIIDQVWHEHLLFSAGYRKFCEEVIKYDFVHSPELVPLSRQTETFKTQYYHTLELYKTEFGIKPPKDVWEGTKFKATKAPEKKRKKEQATESSSLSDYIDGDPLIDLFPDADSSAFEYGGGEFSGGGASGGWDSGGGSDSIFGDSGGDSDGGTSCSSSCGGGCGGD